MGGVAGWGSAAAAGPVQSRCYTAMDNAATALLNAGQGGSSHGTEPFSCYTAPCPCSTVARGGLTYHFHTDGNGYIMLQQRRGVQEEQWAPPISREQLLLWSIRLLLLWSGQAG